MLKIRGVDRMSKCFVCWNGFKDEELYPLLMWPQLKTTNFYCKTHYEEVKTFQEKRIKSYEEMIKKIPRPISK